MRRAATSSRAACAASAPGSCRKADLDDVVDQQHPHHLEPIDPGSGGMLREAEREHRQVPAMLGAVLAPRRIGQDILPLNRFQPVDLAQKTKLLFQSLGRRLGLIHRASMATDARRGERQTATAAVHCLAARNSRATSSTRGYLPGGTARRAFSRSPSARSGCPSARHICANIEVAMSLASSDE
jgi:hypothetical protein